MSGVFATAPTVRSVIHLLVFQPLDVAPVLPNSDLASPIDLDKRASSVLLPVLPFAVVDSAVLPLEDALALPLVIDELALILLAVGPL